MIARVRSVTEGLLSVGLAEADLQATYMMYVLLQLLELYMTAL